MSGDTFEFEDQARVERLIGTLHDPAATPGDVLTVQADKSIAAAPAGGSQPVFAQYGGNPVTINNNASANLTFDSLGAADAPLLDIADPANPTFINAGVYAITLSFTATAPLTANGYAALNVYTAPVAILTSQQAGVEAVGDLGFDISLCTVVKTDAGGTLVARVSNQDGVSARDFYLVEADIIKLA